MGYVIGVLVVAVTVGAVYWNHRNAAIARAGVEFHLPAAVTAVASAIHAAHNVGAGGKLKSFAQGIRVTGGGGSFRFESRIGDVGRISLASDGNGTRVRAATESLHVGHHPKAVSQRATWYGVGSRLTDVTYTILGVTPNAAKMKRFQNGLEAKVAKQLRRSSRV
jgi:hypothetical protein